MRLPLDCRALYYAEGAHDRSEMAIQRFAGWSSASAVLAIALCQSRRELAMRWMAFVMVDIVALAGVVLSMAAPIWTGRWPSSRRQGCPGHR